MPLPSPSDVSQSLRAIRVNTHHGRIAVEDPGSRLFFSMALELPTLGEAIHVLKADPGVAPPLIGRSFHVDNLVLELAREAYALLQQDRPDLPGIQEVDANPTGATADSFADVLNVLTESVQLEGVVNGTFPRSVQRIFGGPPPVFRPE